MKTYRFAGLLAGLLALAGGTFVSTASAQVELAPNTIQGTVRFSNTNPLILDLLNSPANEGMSNLYMYASSLPPANRTAGSDYLPAASRTGTTYHLAVDSDAFGIAYVVSPRVSVRQKVKSVAVGSQNAVANSSAAPMSRQNTSISCTPDFTSL